MTTIPNTDQFPSRYDLSVNEARVELASSDQPRILTGTTLYAESQATFRSERSSI